MPTPSSLEIDLNAGRMSCLSTMFAADYFDSPAASPAAGKSLRALAIHSPGRPPSPFPDDDDDKEEEAGEERAAHANTTSQSSKSTPPERLSPPPPPAALSKSAPPERVQPQPPSQPGSKATPSLRARRLSAEASLSARPTTVLSVRPASAVNARPTSALSALTNSSTLSRAQPTSALHSLGADGMTIWTNGVGCKGGYGGTFYDVRCSKTGSPLKNGAKGSPRWVRHAKRFDREQCYEGKDAEHLKLGQYSHLAYDVRCSNKGSPLWRPKREPSAAFALPSVAPRRTRS